MTFLRSILATAIFIMLLLTIYCMHIAFFSVDVVLYAAIVDGVLATLVAGGILFWRPGFAVLNFLEKTQLIVIWLIAGYAFAVSVPTVIDRSLSFYILEKLQQRGGAIREDAFADVFTKEYIHEYRLIDVRLTEQEKSGTIEIKNGCVRLTRMGQRVASVSSFFRHHLLPGKRLLRGVYTDDLVNPFKNSIPSPDYTCQ